MRSIQNIARPMEIPFKGIVTYWQIEKMHCQIVDVQELQKKVFELWPQSTGNSMTMAKIHFGRCWPQITFDAMNTVVEHSSMGGNLTWGSNNSTWITMIRYRNPTYHTLYTARLLWATAHGNVSASSRCGGQGFCRFWWCLKTIQGYTLWWNKFS